jgi:broad specificity phosphatase PhoE
LHNKRTPKILYLIRHGQSTHNAYAEQHPGDQFVDPYFFDAPLSPFGERQVQELKEKANALHPELIVVSPLSRALVTCLHSFGDRGIPIVVNHLCREKVENACDIGRPARVLQKEFPQFDFSMLPNIWWYTNGLNVTEDNYQQLFRDNRYTEPLESVKRRVEEFKEWLRKRPETTIVIVGHSNFFLQFSGVFLKNCEVLQYVLS